MRLAQRIPPEQVHSGGRSPAREVAQPTVGLEPGVLRLGGVSSVDPAKGALGVIPKDGATRGVRKPELQLLAGQR
jgi:hypothetical protein